jgi:drug/metabolite transporter (DMT)-like permease
VGFALAAGMMWGLVFIGPVLLPEYPAALQSFGRYLAFGLIALPLGWLDRKELSRLSRADWIDALKLAAVGNLLYYLCLASAIQRAGGPLATMIIGTLPVIIAIASNLRDYRRDGRLPWLRLAPSLLAIGLGIACVNAVELDELNALGAQSAADRARHLGGVLLAFAAVACWTWYPLRNADWLRDHPGRNPRAWATAQGLATLPMAFAGYLALWATMAVRGDPLPMPFGPRPETFVGLMVLIGLAASWIGTLCWNEASQRLPTALLGQLIVFETLAALTYAFLLRDRWPAPLMFLGIALLVGGVLWAVRVKPVRVVTEEAAAPQSALATGIRKTWKEKP